MKCNIENSKITERCNYCGKPTKDILCSHKCEKDYNKLVAKRKKKNLCVYCGDPLYVGKDGIKYGACYNCVLEFTLAMKKTNKMKEELNGRE